MTQRAIWLGQRLQALRTDADMTLQQAGDYLGRNPSSVSRFESGETPARIGDVIALMNLYGVDDPQERANMETLAREVWQKGWWDRYRKDLAPALIDYAWMESRASEIRGYDGQLVPGLVQTREYAEAVIRAFAPPSDEWVHTSLAARVKRQEIFEREESFVYRNILDEAALRRPVGGSETMRAQLRHLALMADHERVEIRVLPFGAGEHIGQMGSFQILTQPYPFTEVGVIESIGGSIFVEAEDVQVFSDAYDLLRDQALDRRESVRFITHIEKELG
jgi:transcriptional regulator with XRE-family HTH domain